MVSHTAVLVFHRAKNCYSMLKFSKGKRGALQTRLEWLLFWKQYVIYFPLAERSIGFIFYFISFFYFNI